MSTSTIPEHFPDTYSNSFDMALQQADSRLLPAVVRDTVLGDRKWYNIYDETAFKRVTGRYQQTLNDDHTTSKVWVQTEKWDNAPLIDEWDDKDLDSIVLPTSDVVMAQAAAYARLADEILRDSIKGSRITGETGSVTETFPTGNEIAVDFTTGSNTGLDLGKVAETARIMDSLYVPKSERYFVIGSKQVSDLINNVSESKSRDFVTESILSTGTLHGKTWLGFNWIQYEDLTFDSGDASVRECLAFYKPHICFGDGERRTDIRVRYDLSDALEVRTRTRLGACRKQNSSIIINCEEA